MPNVTLSIDEALLKAGREYAKEHSTSLNDLMRRMLAERVTPPREAGLSELFALMDQANVRAGRKRWKREDLYDV